MSTSTLLANEMHLSVRLCRRVRVRLSRHLARSINPDLPTEAFMAAFGTWAGAFARLHAEGRQVEKLKRERAVGMTDDELDSVIQEQLEGAIRELPKARLLEILEAGSLTPKDIADLTGGPLGGDRVQ